MASAVESPFIGTGCVSVRVERALPPGGKISGVVLADHVKNLDWRARQVVVEAKAPADVVIDVRERLRVLLGL